MSSLYLRLISCCCFLAVLLSAVAIPVSAISIISQYQIVVKVIGGMLICWGGILLALALERTLLSSGGNSAFKLLYLAAAGATGVGVVQCVSGFYSVNMPLALLTFSSMLAIAGLGWWRFYHAAAG